MTAVSATASCCPIMCCSAAMSRSADQATIGGATAVHQNVRIGAHAFVGGLSGVEGDVIPFALAGGNRAHLFGLNRGRPADGAVFGRAHRQSAKQHIGDYLFQRIRAP